MKIFEDRHLYHFSHNELLAHCQAHRDRITRRLFMEPSLVLCLTPQEMCNCYNNRKPIRLCRNRAISITYLTLVQLNPDISFFENSVDLDQLASGEAS